MKKILSILTLILLLVNNLSFVNNKWNSKLNFNSTMINEKYKTKNKKIIISTDGPINSSGTVFDNNIYYGSSDRKVYKYNPVIDEYIAVINADGSVNSSGTVFGDSIYYGSIDGKVYKYNPITNKSEIVIKTDGPIEYSGTVLGDSIYFGSSDRKIYKYNPVINKNIVLSIEINISCIPFTFGDSIYFGSNNGKVYEFNSYSLQINNVINTNGPINSSGIYYKEYIYYGSSDSNIYRYSTLTKLSEKIISTDGPINSSGTVFGDSIYFGSSDGKVYRYHPITNKYEIVIKTNNINEGFLSSGTVFGDSIYFGSIDGEVYKYNPITNKYEIVIYTDGPINSSGTVFGDSIYYGSSDKKIHSYDYITNKSIVITKTDGPINSSGTVFDNNIYYGSSDGKVYEFKFNEEKYFYNKEKKEHIFENDWYKSYTNEFFDVITLNIGKEDPVTKYQYIDFMGVNKHDWSTRVSWDNNSYYGKSLWTLNRNFLDYTDNKEKININDKEKIKELANLKIQENDVSLKNLKGTLTIKQNLGITWYWDRKTKDFNLQILIYQYLFCSICSYSGAVWFKIGTGIKLS